MAVFEVLFSTRLGYLGTSALTNFLLALRLTHALSGVYRGCVELELLLSLCHVGGLTDDCALISENSSPVCTTGRGWSR